MMRKRKVVAVKFFLFFPSATIFAFCIIIKYHIDMKAMFNDSKKSKLVLLLLKIQIMRWIAICTNT